jgi:hypothetical protein
MLSCEARATWHVERLEVSAGKNQPVRTYFAWTASAQKKTRVAGAPLISSFEYCREVLLRTSLTTLQLPELVSVPVKGSGHGQATRLDPQPHAWLRVLSRLVSLWAGV